MIWSPAAFVLARWQFALIATLLVAVLGVSALLTIPRTEDPELNAPNFVITAALPGASPLDIEQQLTKPIENAAYKLDNIQEVRSNSSDGVAVMRVDFVWGTDPVASYNELVREMNALRPSLPSSLARLEILRARPTAVSIVQLALVSDALPMRRLEKIAEQLRERIAAIPGIQEARYWGVQKSELRVSLDFARLSALEIAPDEVVQSLQAAGAEAPIGSVEAGTRRFNIRYRGAYSDAASVAKVPIRAGERTITVGDVAKVDWANSEPDHLNRFNEKRAVFVTATQGEKQDVIALSRAITDKLDDFERALPGGVRLMRGFDQATNVQNRLSMLQRDFLIAIALVTVTLLPLGLRAAGVVMVAIPLSLLIGVLLLANFGFTLNQLAIGGFIVALGILVDDAIVVTENIARRMREGEVRASAVVNGTGQIALAVIGCTACLMLAFLPLLALPEVSGEFIRSLPVAVLTTVLGSLIVSLTVIPLVASVLLSKKDDGQGNRLLRSLNAAIERFYAPILRRALDRPKRTLIGLLLMTTLAFPLLIMIGSSLFPPAQTPQFLIRVEAQPGSTLDRTDRAVRFVETTLRTEPDVAWTSANVGRGNPQLFYNVGQHPTDPAFGEVAVALKEWRPGDSDALIERIRARLSQYSGAKFEVVIFVNGPEIEAPVVIRIAGPSVETLARLAARVEAAMTTTPGLRDVSNPLRRARSDLRLEVDEVAASALGVPAGAIRQTIQLALSGVPVAKLRDSDGDTYEVRVRLPMAGHYDVSALDKIFVPTVSGASIPLASVASPVLDSGIAQIERRNRVRLVSLTANVEPGILILRATEAVLARVKERVDLPPGYTIELGGEAETQARSFAGFIPAIVIASLGILSVLVLEFGKLRTVAVVFGIVPFGLLGGVAALWLTGNSLSFTAAIGLIALMGIEIKNSILLVDFAEQSRRNGVRAREAIERAGEQRFLPVLLTSITAIGGLLPLALERGGLYSPLAITLIGGLVTSTLLARIATPVMYLLLSRGEETSL